MVKPEVSLQSVQIESERLWLVPIRDEDAGPIFREFTAEVTKYMFPRPADTIADTRAFIASSLEGLRQNTNLQLVILKKPDREFLGCLGLHRVGDPDPEVGLWTKTSSHGNGYGLEAATALVRWAHQNLTFDHLVYPVDKRNRPSRRIAEANGGTVVREYQQNNLSGFELDEVEYWIRPSVLDPYRAEALDFVQRHRSQIPFRTGLVPTTPDHTDVPVNAMLNCKTRANYANSFSQWLIRRCVTEADFLEELSLVKNFQVIFAAEGPGPDDLARLKASMVQTILEGARAEVCGPRNETLERAIQTTWGPGGPERSI